jgi:hypothetical protein
MVTLVVVLTVRATVHITTFNQYCGQFLALSSLCKRCDYRLELICNTQRAPPQSVSCTTPFLTALCFKVKCLCAESVAPGTTDVTPKKATWQGGKNPMCVCAVCACRVVCVWRGQWL